MNFHPAASSRAIGPLRWHGRKLARRVWLCDSSDRLFTSLSPEQAFLLLTQKYAMEVKDGGMLWRVTIARTPGSTHQPPHTGSIRDFCTPASVVFKRNAKIPTKTAILGTFEFTNREIDQRDRWAYLLSITDNTRISTTLS